MPFVAIGSGSGMKREREEDAVAKDGSEEDVPPSALLNVEDLRRVAGDGGVEEVPPAAQLDALWEQPVLDSGKRGRWDVLGGVSDALPSSSKKLHKGATLKVNSRPHTALWVRWKRVVLCDHNLDTKAGEGQEGQGQQEGREEGQEEGWEERREEGQEEGQEDGRGG